MPWYTTAYNRLDVCKQRPYRKCEVHTGCWKCGVGRFHLLGNSDHMWQCDNCGHIGHLKVIPQSCDSRKGCSSLCAKREK